MIDSYQLFIACAFLLWAVSTPRDRNALRIVLIASIASEAIVYGITRHISGAWKLTIPSLVDFLTILALLKWSLNRTGIIQIGLLLVAWAAHWLCYVDIILKTDLVYSHYETVLAVVSFAQLASCYDTMRSNLLRAWKFMASGWNDCFLDIRTPSHGSVLSLGSIDTKASEDKGTYKAIQRTPLAAE